MLLLIGSDGFIGRHLTIEAVRREIPLTLVSTQFDLDFLGRHAPTTVAIPSSEFASPAYDEAIGRAAAVIYLAGRSVPGSSIDQPSLEFSENVEPAFATFLRVSAISPNTPIVYISSGGTIYGRTDAAHISETHPVRPISPYGLGKRLSENCLRYCADVYGQRFTILRVANPVGRWHRSLRQGLVAAVIRAIFTDTPLRIFGDGTAVRDYLDADDLADAILRAAASEIRDAVWNVSSGEGHATLEVVELVANVVGKKPNIQFAASRPFDIERCVLSAKLIERDLGWRATTPLVKSIEKIVRGAADEAIGSAGDVLISRTPP